MKKLKELLDQLNPSIEAFQDIQGSPDTVYEPIRYILNLGGKRIRPALLLAAHRLYSDEYHRDTWLVAEAIEMFHNFTLLHDDIMDRAELRRGRPTVHVQWDEPTAILSGDLLLILAYQKLTQVENRAILDLFNRMAIELCEGQMNDMQFEAQEEVSNDDYIEMIRQKTAVLLGFSLQAGGILGGATPEEGERLYRLGIDLGLAFQLMDDYLDSFGTTAKVGKRIGGDILERKKTYLWNAMWEVLNPNQRQEVLAAFEKDEEYTIQWVKRKMEETGAKNAVQQLAEKYTAKTEDHLKALECPGSKDYLTEIIHLLSERES